MSEAVHLDYNEQCDVALGRIMRTVDEDPSVLESRSLGDLVGKGVSLTGLGLSGGQAQMVLDVAIARARELVQLREAVERAWGVIANARGWDPTPADGQTQREWREAAEHWRDHFYTPIRVEDAQVTASMIPVGIFQVLESYVPHFSTTNLIHGDILVPSHFEVGSGTAHVVLRRGTIGVGEREAVGYTRLTDKEIADEAVTAGRLKYLGGVSI